MGNTCEGYCAQEDNAHLDFPNDQFSINNYSRQIKNYKPKNTFI